MKNILLILFLSFASCFAINAQSKTSVQVVNNQIDTGKYSFQYLVGTDKLSGYEPRACVYSTSMSPDPTKPFKNGKSAPILKIYETNKALYIGGILENEQGKTTIITDIALVENDTTLVFTVFGADFSMSFTLETGVILKEEETMTLFYTNRIGVWKINKKK